MRRLAIAAVLAAFAAAALAPSASAEFGLSDFDVTFTDQEGEGVTQAGSHPYAMKTSFSVNTEEVGGGTLPSEAIKDLEIAQILGFAGDLSAVPACATADFLKLVANHPQVPQCADSSAIGTATVTVGTDDGMGDFTSPVYLLEPPPGRVAKVGFVVQRVRVSVDIGLDETSPLEDSSPYKVVAHTRNISQVLEFFGGEITVWGVPADPGHDTERGLCVDGGSCPAGILPKPFLTLPRACSGPLATEYELDSWLDPGAWVKGFALTHDDATPPNPLGMTGCGKLGFGPLIEAQPSSTSAESSSGFDFRIDVNDEGLKNREGIAQADIEGVRLTLPAGMTANPSAAEGLGVCTKAQYEAEHLQTASGQGCPDAAKLGSLEAESPLLEGHPFNGSIYLAQQDDPATAPPGAENPFDSLLALYFVIRDPALGIFVKLPASVEPDESTGRLVTTVEGMPQVPLSRVLAHLRSGPRAPLITPPTCGTYTTEAVLTPSSGGPSLTVPSSFEITSGVGGGACPPGGVPSLAPGFSAGSTNNAAGAYSPFSMRLTRSDGEQDMTRFSAVLPRGVTGKLAGIPRCPDAQIEAAKHKTGRQEQASPSCPGGSQIGSVLGGAGVGSALTYVSGRLYLAGPFGGDPLSVVAIVPAVAGPFDVGTVVVRVALALNPTTGEVEVDGANSDPIPHILKGIPLKVRDIRVFADRPNFTLNPTSCDESKVRATLFGSYLDVFSPNDDVPVALSARYQAAGCLNLGFKPKLAFKLKGDSTKRGGHPAFTATYTPRPGDANLEGLVARLPRSAFLDQAHIRTICTRVQFAAKACPPGAQYGSIKAWTPLLDEPLEGPVWLRSSNHKLPDLVFDLHGLVDVEVAARIDSFRGGIRSTLEELPDAPLSKVVLTMQGGKKGLIVNSRDLCAAPSKADVQLDGQNGRRASSRPLMRADCGGKRKGKRGR